MSADDHTPHLRRHLKELDENVAPTEIAALLRRVGVDLRSEEPLCADTCTAYLDAVRENLGELAYRMARLNFFLAGCPTARDGAMSAESSSSTQRSATP